MIPSWLSTSLWISLYAVLWALMEVEIEGADGGWAKNLPTKKFFGTKFTWYHIIMNTIVILTIAYALYARSWIEIVFYTVAWFMIEDFIWFMSNKAFGWSKYNKEDIWWHSDQPWVCGIPLHNYICVFMLALLAYMSGDPNLVKSGILFGGVMISGVFYSCLR